MEVFFFEVAVAFEMFHRTSEQECSFDVEDAISEVRRDRLIADGGDHFFLEGILVTTRWEVWAEMMRSFEFVAAAFGVTTCSVFVTLKGTWFAVYREGDTKVGSRKGIWSDSILALRHHEQMYDRYKC